MLIMKKEKEYNYEKISCTYVNLYRLLGFLPIENEINESSGFLRLILKNRYTGIFFYIASTIHSTMHVGYGIRMIKDHRMEIDFVCELFICQNIFLRYVVLFLYRDDLLILMRYCKKLSSFLIVGEVEIIRVFERKVNVLKNFFMWSSIVATTFYIMTAQFVRIPSKDVNGTATKILPSKFYVDIQDDPWYTIVSILQGTVCYATALILAGIESVGPFLILMACGYLKAIQNRLLTMATSGDTDSIKVSEANLTKLPVHEVLNCVKFHQNIMEFCDKIEHLTRGLFMIQVSCTIYNISLIGLKLLENDRDQMRYVSILVLNFLQFFTCQWIPEHLLTESKAIESAAYSATLSHSHYEHEANRMLFIMMMRAQKPVQLTAGGFIRLSLESFQRMFVNAYSFFTVMR